MGNACQSQNSSLTLINNSKKNINNSSSPKKQAECSLKIIVETKPNKQNPVQAFTYKLNDHLDSFNEEFFEKSYQVDIQKDVSQKFVDQKTSSNMLILLADQPTFSPKFGQMRIARTQVDRGTQNKKKRRPSEQARRSQEVIRNCTQKSILKTTSKSYDTIQAKKKQVRFGRVSIQYKVPRQNIKK